eukprot:GHRQ01004659.1.p1 GENE.GHRQ01004659.1~~GHRQ01004659.1.p1  ORF type:complete len:300 (+),score=98.09 GHRQ01004659.1:135-1034(+)
MQLQRASCCTRLPHQRRQHLPPHLHEILQPQRGVLACSAKDADAMAAAGSIDLQLGQPEPRQLQQQHAQQGCHTKLADVDWSRYHLQVLFIDRHDQLRARLAAGLFEKVAEWNGYGRALYPWTCGTHVDDSVAGRTAHMWLSSSLIGQAAVLGIEPKVFMRSPEAFELRDLDCYDVVIALDSATREELLAQVDPQCQQYYRDQINLLSDYAQQQLLTDAEVQRTGGLALLPRGMSRQLQQHLGLLRGVVDVARPSLADGSPQGVAAWNWTVLVVMLGCAGLVRYLIDAYPSDLPEYDPL